MCRKLGRKATMLIAGLLFDIGVVFMAAAQNFGMLIAGRVLLGVAVAFASVAVTLYNSEMAPAHMRGRLNQIFQVQPPWCSLSPPIPHNLCIYPGRVFCHELGDKATSSGCTCT